MLAQRIGTALLLVGGAVASVLLLPTQWLALAFGLFWVAGSWEWAAFGGCQGPARIVYALAMAALMFVLYRYAIDIHWILLVATVWWVLAFIWILNFPTPISARVVPLVGIFVLVPSWFALIELHGQPQGAGLVLALLAVVSAADVGAYFAGRQWGRHKLAPQVSPKKTWEGVSGGLLAAALVAAGAAWFMGFDPAVLMLIGALTALVSIVGDLTVSMFKRNAGLKDSGVLLPGHGGVMDRIDSLSAAAPCFCIALALAGMIST